MTEREDQPAFAPTAQAVFDLLRIFPFVATIERWSADGLPAQVVMSRSNSVATSGGAPFPIERVMTIGTNL